MKKWFLLYRINVHGNGISVTKRVKLAGFIDSYSTDSALFCIKNASTRAEKTLHALIVYFLPITRRMQRGFSIRAEDGIIETSYKK